MDHAYWVIRNFDRESLERLASLEDFSGLRKLLEERGLAVDHAPDLARCLRDKKLYKQAITLLEGSLKIPDEELRDPVYHHEKTHALYGFFLLHLVDNEAEILARNIGVPISKLNFQYSKEKVLYIPGLPSPNAIQDGLSDEKYKEATLGRIHLKIAQKPHSNKDCPYLAQFN